ncbi:L-aspartate oxidase [Ferrithrix thermotolerans DSM 19514]|uniref:L-aspartate oxidase n=1 Tax=Ferrithrix thermotolerans DSM 19514 TaxID=1121881 RepID=A0A1M4UI30_9ACTN|nr:FAD-dependent oxidoreductase [Ferrithrix thermotolerans]SHE56220.1 L-aspartate oxidase [Ferrithrix thermotolerans DSM 19514]
MRPAITGLENTVRCDVLVIGSGIAGTYAATVAAESGADVVMLTKTKLMSGSTRWAQGGIAFPLDEHDVASHTNDTVVAGRGLTDRHTAESLIEESLHHLERLKEKGVIFDTELGLEGGHSRARVKHVGGDRTGYFVLDMLQKSMPERVLVYEDTVAYHLIGYNASIFGALAFSSVDPRVRMKVLASATIIATGGSGQLFEVTTNPAESTGDGFALAYRAGAVLRDMELIQFHPTALKDGTLISEACRGEGALLYNSNGERFMERYDPAMELAPRDVVAQAISDQIRQGYSVYLDLSPISGFEDKFPFIADRLKSLGLINDLGRVPIAPAAHYFMGGIASSPNGETTLKNLFCAGEVASTAFHGANRLASNSLLEGLVTGSRAALSALATSKLPVISQEDKSDLATVVEPASAISEIKSLSQRHLSYQREEEGITSALRKFDNFTTSTSRPLTRQSIEATNLLDVARVVAIGALKRRESRGGHFRSDFPHPSNSPYHILQSINSDPISTPLDGAQPL